MAEDMKKNHVEYEFYEPLHRIKYIVKDADDKIQCSLSINDKDIIYLSAGEDEKRVASMYVIRDKRVQNIGAAQQYACINEPLDVNSIEGIMGVYKKIKDGKYTISGDVSQKEKIGKLVTDFFDSYVFNTPESKEVLNEFLDKGNKSRTQKNAFYAQNLTERN